MDKKEKERAIRAGRIIRQARKAKGWTQGELGAKIGFQYLIGSS